MSKKCVMGENRFGGSGEVPFLLLSLSSLLLPPCPLEPFFSWRFLPLARCGRKVYLGRKVVFWLVLGWAGWIDFSLSFPFPLLCTDNRFPSWERFFLVARRERERSKSVASGRKVVLVDLGLISSLSLSLSLLPVPVR